MKEIHIALPELSLRNAQAQLERELLNQVLEETGFNIVAASEMLGVSRSHVYYLTKKHRLQIGGVRRKRLPSAFLEGLRQNRRRSVGQSLATE